MKGDSNMIEVKVYDLTTHRDEYVVLDVEIDESMSDAEVDKIVKPHITQYFQHNNYKILTYSEIL